MDEINVSPGKDAMSSERKNIPPGLKSAIMEARSHTKVAGLIIKRPLKHGYSEAIGRLAMGHQEGVDAFSFCATYNAVQGDIHLLGDILQVAIDKPELCGNVTPERMYALLALAYERSIPFQDSNLAVESAYIRRFSAEEMDGQLDRRNLMVDQMNDFKTKAGEEYQKVKDLAESPTFAKFKPPT